MTQKTHSSASPGFYDRLLAAERIGIELALELEIRAPEAMLREALGSRGSTIRAILSEWIQQQEDLTGGITYPASEEVRLELSRRLKARLLTEFPDCCNY